MSSETNSLGKLFPCSDRSTIANLSVNRCTVRGRSRNRVDGLIVSSIQSTRSSIKLEGRFFRFSSHKWRPESRSVCNIGSISFMCTFCFLNTRNMSAQERWRRFKVLGRRLNSNVGHNDLPSSIHHSTSCRLSNVVKYKRGQGIQQDRDQQSEVLFKPPFFNLIFKIQSPHCHKRICSDVVAMPVIHSSISGGKMEREDMSREDWPFSCSNSSRFPKLPQNEPNAHLERQWVCLTKVRAQMWI